MAASKRIRGADVRPPTKEEYEAASDELLKFDFHQRKHVAQSSIAPTFAELTQVYKPPASFPFWK